MKRAHQRAGALLLPLLVLVASEAVRAGEWEQVYPTAQYRKLKKPVKGKPCVFHVMKLDISEQGASVAVSPPSWAGKKTSEFAEDMEAQVAINGGFWKLVTHDPLGLMVSAGRRWPEAQDDEKHGYLAFTKDGRAWISPPEVKKHPSREEGWMVVSGYPMIVRDGQPGKVRGCGYICMVGPRTAVGLDETGETLFLVVVDGRQEKSGGTDLVHLADFMIDLGVHEALNLDGGGSATLWVEAMGGTVNTPSEGRERAVLNSVAFFVPETLPEPSAEEEAAQEETSDQAPAATEAEPVDAAPPVVTFQDDDYEMGDHPDPPRLLKLLLWSAAGGLMLLGMAVTGIVIVVRGRRRRRRDGPGS